MFNQRCGEYCDSFQQHQHNSNQYMYNYSQSENFNDSSQTYGYTNPYQKSTHTVHINENKNDSSSCNNIESYQSLQNNHDAVPRITNNIPFHETRNNYCQYTNSSDNVTHNHTPNHEANTNYNQSTNKCNYMTMLEDTLTIETLLYTLKKGITNAQNALIIAKMVSTLINKTENHEIVKEIVKKLTNENIVNLLTNSIVKHSNNPQIIKECRWALNVMVKTLLINNTSVQEQSKRYPISELGHKCKECGKVYKHLCNLRTHSKIHTESCYICSFCNKRFGRKYNYTEHIRVHTGESPFECNVCLKRFKQKHGLKNHKKKCHSDSC